MSQAILVLKSLYQYQSAAPGTANKSLIISGLARRLDSIRHPAARSCVVWLVGQYADAAGGPATVVPGIEDWAPDVLRKVAKSFAEEVWRSPSPKKCRSLMISIVGARTAAGRGPCC